MIAVIVLFRREMCRFIWETPNLFKCKREAFESFICINGNLIHRDDAIADELNGMSPKGRQLLQLCSCVQPAIA